MRTVIEPALVPELRTVLTPRTGSLRDALLEHASTDRKGDWIDKPVLNPPPDSELESVIIRRARGIAAVLEALTDPEQSKRTGSLRIAEHELLVGVLPMGSNGLGKVFPDYLSPEERHMASIASRSELSIQGHNTVNYERLLTQGIDGIVGFCKNQIDTIKAKPMDQSDQDRVDFYQAVIISCEAVVKYAASYERLAREMADRETKPQRKAELQKIAEVCHQVPRRPARTFYEALQSILFVQIGIRAGMDLMSLGRLDQTLQPFLDSTVEPGRKDLDAALELVECFVIKAASPLNLTLEHLVEQDHVDYGIVMGTHQWYVDQRGNVNQFLQNVVVGGKKPDGTDATVECTHILIQAWANTCLPTPGLYVRLHSRSPLPLLERVKFSIARTGCLPAILNDDVVIPGLRDALTEDGTLSEREATQLANDYTADGCWEPILNGCGDWTFNMINGMTILECALNEGATLDPNPMVLRGGKRSYRTPPVRSYEELQRTLKTTMEFFVFQSAVAMYNYYLLDEFVTPTPLYSAFAGTCLERGRDKSWGGMAYYLGGTILSGLPNMVNSIAAINTWVFEAKKYKLADVLSAYRYNFKAPDSNPETQAIYSAIQADFFLHSPKYGNNDRDTNQIARFIVDTFLEAVQRAKKFADKVYRVTPADEPERTRIQRLRLAGGYYGPGLEDRLKEKITVAFTAGLGTFASYTLLGQGVAASADRHANDPLAMNNTPSPGTMDGGDGHTLATLKGLDLSRFAAGAPVDLCLQLESEPEDVTERDLRRAALVGGIIDNFLRNDGHTLSLTFGNTEVYREIYNLSVRASQNDREAARALLKYGHVIVRAGGWQTPFITMSLDQQKHYTISPIAIR